MLSKSLPKIHTKAKGISCNLLQAYLILLNLALSQSLSTSQNEHKPCFKSANGRGRKCTGVSKNTEASYQKEPIILDLNLTALFAVAVKY